MNADVQMPVDHRAELVAGVSQHLAKLRLVRMVSARQGGPRDSNRLSDEHAGHLVDEVFLQAEHALDGTPAHHLDRGVQ